MITTTQHRWGLLVLCAVGCGSEAPESTSGTTTNGTTATTETATTAVSTTTSGAGTTTTMATVTTSTTSSTTGTTGSATADSSTGTGGTSPTSSASVSSTGGASTTGGDPIPSLDDCPLAPAGASAEAILALNTENTARLAMGLDCAELITELNLAAQNHCDYYVQNQGGDCEAPSPHNEISGCPGFTGEGPGQRMSAAGYMSRGGSETMAFANDPERAVTMFINSVYHRTPILDPWMRHMGYGAGTGCDTIDFGTGPETASDVTAFYPYQGQVDVPVSFDGSREGPEPPIPSTGWPSGYPVTLFGRDLEVQSHAIYVDDTMEELSHLWLAEDDPTLPSYAKVLYSEAPLEPMTTYRVVISTTRGGETLDFDWTFTTGAASGRGF